MAAGLGVLLVLSAGTMLLGPRLREAVTGAGTVPHSSPVPTPDTGTAHTVSGRSQPTGSVDDSTRRATVNGASITLPGEPYDITPDPVRIGGVFDVCFMAEAGVHPRTATAPGWAVMVGLAHLDPALKQRLDTDGPGALQAITTEFFGSHQTRLTDAVTSSTTVSGRTALKITATVHYDVSGLASTYDEVTVIVVELDDDSTVIAMASVPDDTPRELRRLATASLATLTIS